MSGTSRRSRYSLSASTKPASQRQCGPAGVSSTAPLGRTLAHLDACRRIGASRAHWPPPRTRPRFQAPGRTSHQPSQTRESAPVSGGASQSAGRRAARGRTAAGGRELAHAARRHARTGDAGNREDADRQGQQRGAAGAADETGVTGVRLDRRLGHCLLSRLRSRLGHGRDGQADLAQRAGGPRRGLRGGVAVDREADGVAVLGRTVAGGRPG